jgi:alpha-glucosidase (family GH31 glycosyl hydrolase)
VDDYKSRSIPLDVFVLDMDWHRKNDWTGYTFDEHLFPFPEDTLGFLKGAGLHVAANLHDASGVGAWEDKYAEMCAAVGQDPSQGKAVPFSIVNKSHAYALEDIVVKAVVDQGMDFWWIDWQQGGKQGGAAGGKQNPTVMTDKLRCTNRKRQGSNVRGLTLARWGGLGNHRYQVGFSGDVNGLTWENLAYQPYFSMTSANVAYGVSSRARLFTMRAGLWLRPNCTTIVLYDLYRLGI